MHMLEATVTNAASLACWLQMGALQPSKVEDVKLRYLRYMVWWAEQMSGDQQKKSEALENFRQQVGASDWQLPALGVGHCPFGGVARVLHAPRVGVLGLA